LRHQRRQRQQAGYFPALVINGTETKYPATRFSAGDVIKVYTKVTTTGTTVRVTGVTKGVTKQRTCLSGRPAPPSPT